MADEIIDFYKKAKEPEEPQKPIEEQKETPVPEIPKPDEPFDRFLLELAEKLQKEKVITEKQQETFVEQIKEPVSTDPNENDPFKKFIGSFANILKEDELVNREENIKEATISFINKLKEQPDEPFVIPDEPLVKTKKQKYLPSKIAKKIQKLPQSVKKEEPVVEEQADELVKQEEPNDENKYVKELKTADKTNKKLPEKVKSVSDIKSIVEKQVAEILSRYPNLGFTGGGGGTNAVQYALGGTMDGDLNVTGKYLSGGVDISTLFGSGGGAVSGIPDRLISGSQSLILNTDGSISFPDGFITAPDGQILNIQSETVSPSSFARISLSPYAFFAYDNEGNSISFDVVDNAIVLTSKNQYEWTFNQQGVLAGPNGYLTVNALSSLGRILSGGKDLLEIFALSGTGGGGGGTGRDDVNTVVISNSANWNTAYNVATAYQSVSSSYATIPYVNSNFLALSGGLVSGPVRINNNLTIFGNLTATGTTTFANTTFSVTSALSVVHIGSGPAMYIGNSGDGDIASFYDIDQNVEVLHVGGNNGTFPNVGVKTSTPNKDFTVQGELSASNTIYDRVGNSNQWNSAYTILQSSSANYILQGGNTFSIPLTVGTNDNQSLVLETGGTNRVTILSSGQVGIGTNNPANTLTVTGTANPIARIINSNSTVNYQTVFSVLRGSSNLLRVRDDSVTESNAFACNADGSGAAIMGTDGFYIRSSGSFAFSSEPATAAYGLDTYIRRDGAGIIALYNGLNSQTFRLYNNRSNATSYQRSTLTHANSALVLGTEYTTTAGNSALSGQAMPIILAPGYNQSLSATAPIVLQQTWNNANNAFTLLSANVIDNASNSNSKLIDLQVNGNTFFNVDKTGTIRFGSGGTNRLQLFGDSLLSTDVQVNSIRGYGNTGFVASGVTYKTVNTGTVEWARSSNPFDTSDLILLRDNPSTLAQRNGLSAQAFRIYNTYTAGTPVSSEFGYLQWSGNTLQLGTSATGSGSARALQFQVGGTTRFQITSVGALALGSVITVWENTAGMYISNNGAGINFNNGLSISNNGGFENGSGGRFRWKDSVLVTSGSYDLGFQRNSAGVLEINNGTAGTFRDVVVRTLNFGGTTAAFPALKNSLSGIQIRRADDSDFAPLTASNITATNYLSAGVNLLQILGPTVRQFDYVVTDGISYNYCGTAPNGSITSDSTWTIKRLLFTSAGTLLSSGIVNNSIWNNRYSYSY